MQETATPTIQRPGKITRATIPTSMRITRAAEYLHAKIAVRMGISKTSAFEVMIREKANSLGIQLPPAYEELGEA